MVCFHEDDWTEELQDRRTPLWRARLSDGRVAIQDDGRPGLVEHSAWLRLASFLRESGLSIVEFWPQFRSHAAKILPAYADAYFFSKSAAGILNVDGTYQFVLFGALKDGVLRVKQLSSPELIQVDESVRDPNFAGKAFIRNPQ